MVVHVCARLLWVADCGVSGILGFQSVCFGDSCEAGDGCGADVCLGDELEVVQLAAELRRLGTGGD